MAGSSDAFETFVLPCGLELVRKATKSVDDYDRIRRDLDTHEGALLACRATFPGRYQPNWVGFTRPPLRIAVRHGKTTIEASSPKGEVLLRAVDAILAPIVGLAVSRRRTVVVDDGVDPFSLFRAIIAGLFNEHDPHWGLFGAFGHDIALDRYQVVRHQQRSPDQEDIVLYIPDRLSVCEGTDFATSTTYEYDFRFPGEAPALAADAATDGIESTRSPATAPSDGDVDYKAIVADAVEACESGRLFEVVGSKSFFRRTDLPPSEIFGKLVGINPSPYCFLANFGREHIVGASPEMFVRVTGRVVETCPIAGTVRRGADAFEDADRILDLLNSPKVDAELTMCSDLDFDDKAKVCDPRSIELIGRRQIELYSHVIHTVDHIRGRLDDRFDALDAFCAHLWAVTLTGAPRKEALDFIEAREGSPRRWYGGAVGRLGFDGDVDTGIILRAMRFQDGVAEIRVGASLLHGSVPEEEESEILAKAAAMFKVVGGGEAAAAADGATDAAKLVAARAVIVDLGGPFLTYLRGTLSSHGIACDIAGLDAARGMDWTDTIALLSPGLDDASLRAAMELVPRVLEQGGAVIGLGHGMLAVAEHYGVPSRVLDEPKHGVRCGVRQVTPGSLIPPVPEKGAQVGLYCRRMSSPGAIDGVADLRTVWADDEGTALAIEHCRDAAVGLVFQPQSVLSRPKILIELLDRVRGRLLRSAG